MNRGKGNFQRNKSCVVYLRITVARRASVAKQRSVSQGITIYILLDSIQEEH